MAGGGPEDRLPPASSLQCVLLGEFGSVSREPPKTPSTSCDVDYLLETRSPKAASNSYLFSQVVYMIPVAPGVRSSEPSQSFGF